nr:hypothetical protein [uncultured Draconibacterium sp.]
MSIFINLKEKPDVSFITILLETKLLIIKQIANPFKIISSRVFIAVIALLTLTACSPENKSNLQTETSSAKLASNLLQEINNTSGIKNQNIEASVQPEPHEEKTTEAQVRLNPPHGDPGHRCDIAVGSPLPSENIKPDTLTFLTT